jgi:choline dehydrogenase-like flavoprotein
MTTSSVQRKWAEMLRAAERRETTPFDYVVVGSGAGGGPLAARLALEGRRVLVIEAGVDPATGEPLDDPSAAPTDPDAMREVYVVPGYHGASTEDERMSWEFSVRHFADEARQREDEKYCGAKDPSVSGGAGKGGIFYPRASALGGCTAHHAMVMVRPNDEDWERIAQTTGDESWRAQRMHGYFAKLEECLYYKVYRGFLGWIRWLFALIDPRSQRDPGGHGDTGWQKTSFIHPVLVIGIVRADWAFLRILLGVLRSALADKGERRRILRALLRLQIVQLLDPNVRSADFPTRASSLSLIPVGTDGASRCGVREHLLDVAGRRPCHLVLRTGVFAKRVLFERREGEDAPRAVGVEVAQGLHLYGASPLHTASGKPPDTRYFARCEVILCGGAFNTPQLLMLSGIGEADHLRARGIQGLRDEKGAPLAELVNLPGVGRNLQDRYEVGVISEMTRDFKVLKGASLRPGDEGDPTRLTWRRDKAGLYGTNGSAVAMLISSEANRGVRREPDLFVFGVPAAFRGYYWNYSRELLRRTIGAPEEQRNLWTWLILKAYTDNSQGKVRLLSDDPFAPPKILFNSFPDRDRSAGDIAALCEGVRKVREVNSRIGAIAEEIQPGVKRKDGSKELAAWVQSQAWGHHACGTCRIGADPWQADVTKLRDPGAVLDSKFRVHGVYGLRVVDASVFPRIPGYFIVSSVFMVSEKAADTLLMDSPVYPRALERAEARAVDARRAAAGGEAPAVPGPTRLPPDTVGLALSGGGIRSATFCLGVLQALARFDRLGQIDFLSTVSGGGHAGAFLGRLFTRLGEGVADKVGRVKKILTDPASPEIWWLRRNADYIAGAGRADLETNLAIVVRNLGAVYALVGALLFGIFGALRFLADACSPGQPAWTRLEIEASLRPWACSFDPPAWTPWGIELSPWWWVPLVVLFVAAVLAIGYWLVPSGGREYAARPLLLWGTLLAGAVYGLSVPGAAPWSAAAIVALLLGWLVEEVTHWRVDRRERGSMDTAAAAADPERAPESVQSTLVRSRLTRALGAVLAGLVVSILWVVLDSLARVAADPEVELPMDWLALGSALLVLLLRGLAVARLQAAHGDQAVRWYAWARKAIVAGLAFLLAAILVFFADALAHLAFETGELLGRWATVTALAASLIVGRWFRFLNLSSLQQAYGQKLVRTFLGASNDVRVRPSRVDGPLPIEIPSPDDDLFFDEYQPERHGGPLHLVNTCLNHTVAGDSGRQLQDDKGLPMCAGPAGLSVGVRYHALWEPRRGLRADESLVRPLPVTPDPNAFHVLARSDRDDPRVERLTLGQWLAISAAAVATGAGRLTSVPQSLLLGLLNVRVGYWWNSGIRNSKRPGRYPPNLWRRLKSVPAFAFRTQAMLLNEWRAYFPGPAEKRWFLSDGGHFENSGLFELIRRRLAFIIAIDGGEDNEYRFDDLAILIRQARVGFGATIDWFDPSPARAQGKRAWEPFDDAFGAEVPEPIRSFVDPDAVGGLSDLKRDGPYCSALAHITYDGDDDRPRGSWLLLLKANLAPKLPLDVRNYAARHTTFPNEPTADQFFKDDQWESYRALGESAGAWVFRAGEKTARAAMREGARPAPKAVVVRTLSAWDTLRLQLFVAVPTAFRGFVAANHWPAWLRSGTNAGRPTMRFLGKLRAKYGADHLWTWFPVWARVPLRRTLLVFAPETIKAVLESEANAADALLKTRALSRFVPEALLISSGDKWRVRRKFNEEVLGSGKLHRHCDAFTDIVLHETRQFPGDGGGELTWPDFQALGARVSQRVILGIGRGRPEMAEQLQHLVRCSNFLVRGWASIAAFYHRIDQDLQSASRAGRERSLVAVSAKLLAARGATETTRVPTQIGFWLYVLKDAMEVHVPRTLALLAAHPHEQKRVRREIADAGRLTPDAIHGLSLLEACLLEQLRLWTPVPILLRRAVKPFFLHNEIPIEAEQQILIHAGFYHRDARYFHDRADRFSPDAVGEDGFPATYFFSAHRQECAGRSLVTFVLKATLASLLSRFNFELIGPTIEAREPLPYLYDHFSVKLQTRPDD